MNIQFFYPLLFTFSLFSLSSFCDPETSGQPPYVRITAWPPPPPGCKIAGWARIGFNQDISDVFMRNTFYPLLKTFTNNKALNLPRRHGVFKQEFVLNTDRTQSEFGELLNKINRHLDPEIEKREQQAIQQTKEEIAREMANKEAVQTEAKRKREEEQRKIEEIKLKSEKLEKDAFEQLRSTDANPALRDMLHNAVMSNSHEDILRAVRAGAAISCGKDGKPSLLWAVLFKRINAVDALLQSGADNTIIYSGLTLVGHAINLGDLETACLLRKNGANCTGYEEKLTNYLDQRLYSAIMNDRAEEIRRAIYLGANIRTKNSLHTAVEKKKCIAVRELIEQGADVNNVSLMLKAMQFPDFDIAMLLLKNGTPFYGNLPNQPFPISIIARAIMCHSSHITWTLEFLKEVIGRGFNINNNYYADNLWYLTFRLSQGNENILNYLISRELDVNQLIDTDAFTSRSSFTPLFLAIYCNNISAIRILLKAGANVNQQARPTNHPFWNGAESFDLCRPLFYAIKMNRTEIAEMLVLHGAHL